MRSPSFPGRFSLVALVLFAFLINADEADDALSRHREKLGVLRWHGAGHRGSGVKVCILDTDFAGFQPELGETLPRKVRVRSFRQDRDLEAPSTGHGLRAAQVIHALAPGAELMFANWDPDSPECFLDAVRWARGQGARIITCSVTSAAWGDGDGGGPIHRQLEQIIGKGTQRDDPLFFCSAGNMALGHWSGSFTGAGELHEWQPGKFDNWLTPYGETKVKVSLVHKPGCYYELLVYEGTAIEPIASRMSDAESGPAVSFTPRRGQEYRLRVRHAGGKSGAFHCVARYASLNMSSPRDSICCFPADNANVVTVGAIDWLGKREDYSACGGHGVRLKPEFVAPVPFPCPGRESSFGGTSAAAPQAAALAVLLADRHAGWTAKQLREALLSSVQPIGKPGHRPETGHGMIQLLPPK